MTKLGGIAVAFLISTGGLAQAQVGTTTTIITSPAPVQVAGPTLRASQVLGSTVHLQGTNNYGKVEDIILSEDGGPTYLVVANAGRSVLMPLTAATFDQGQRTFTYEVTPQAVQPLSFTPNTYPNLADPQFMTRTNQVFPNAEKIKYKVRPNGTIKEKIKN